MNDPVAIALVMGAPLGRRLRMLTAAGVTAELRVRRKRLSLNLFQFLARARHVTKLEGYAIQRMKAILWSAVHLTPSCY
jgi:hypothetical protein